MKKNDRQEKILEIISTYDISTQDQLLEKLNESGYNVTQATVSRDIKAMNLIKIQDASGQYKYSSAKMEGTVSHYNAILANCVISVDHAMNITVVRCYPGMANAAGAAIDAMETEEILGTIAGDDTIFVLNRTEEAAKNLVETIKSATKL